MSETRQRPPTATILRLLGWAVFFLGLAIWAGPSALRCGGTSPLVGQPAPTFEGAIAAGEGAGSDRISLEGLRGRPVLLDLWASWCAPCRASIPILSRVAARHREAGLVTLGVNIESEQPPRASQPRQDELAVPTAPKRAVDVTPVAAHLQTLYCLLQQDCGM